MSVPSALDVVDTGPFTLVTELGRGGMGVVYEVLDPRGVRMALKSLRELGARDILRLKTEFRALRDLQHPNVVRLGELFERDGRWFFTMELVDGVDFLRWVRPDDSRPPPAPEPSRGTPTLAEPAAARAQERFEPRLRPASATEASSDTIADPATSVDVTELSGDTEQAPDGRDQHAPPPPPPRERRPGPGFDEARLRAALRGVVDGLAALHRAGLVHRDIKPSNLKVEPGGRVVVLDLGVVAELDRPLEAEVVGTWPYMAPEQAIGRASPASDWYALGVMLFRALTGYLPFPGGRHALIAMRHAPPSPDDYVAELPADLATLCTRLLTWDPDRRPGEAELRAVLGAGLPLPAPATAAPPFIGRDPELAALRASFDRGGARAIAITGDSGVGKTAVVRRFLRELAERRPDAIVLEARCDPRELVPYNALDGIVDDLTRVLVRPGVTTSSIATALTGPGLVELARLFPVLRSIDRIDPGHAAIDRTPVAAPRKRSDTAAQRSVADARASAVAALGELLASLARHRPVVLFLDDLHWADADSVALLGELLAGDDAPPLMVVATARIRAAECPALAAMRIDLRELALGGLDPDDARRLAAAVGGAAVDPDALTRDTDGHPMFIAELARFAAERASDGRARTGRPARAATATAGLDDALWARACELEVASRKVLDVVVIAGAVSPAVAAAAAELTHDDFDEALASLRVGRLIRIGDERIEPYHDRVREALAGRMPRPARAAVHGRLAAALSARQAGPELLAHHLAGAGDQVAAAAHAEAAAVRAAATLAFDRAAEWYAMAIDLGDAPDDARRSLLVARGEMLVRAGRPHDAGAAFLAAAATGELDRVERQELRRRAAEQYLMGGYLDEGMAVAGELLAELDLALPTSPRRALASLVWHQTRFAMTPLRWTARPASEVSAADRVRVDACWSAAAGLSLVDSVRGAIYAARSPVLSLRAGEPFRIARSLLSASFLAAGMVQPRRFERLAAAVTRAVAETDLPEARCYLTMSQVARAFFVDSDWARAVTLAEQGLEQWRAAGRGLGWESDCLEQFIAWALSVMGQHSRLDRHVRWVLRGARRTGNRFLEVGFRVQFPGLHLLNRDDHAEAVARARADLEEAFAQWVVPPGVDPAGNQFFWTVKSRTFLTLYAGDLDETYAGLSADWATARRSLLARVPPIRLEIGLWEGQWHLALAAAAATRGEVSELRSRLAQAERCAALVRSSPMPVSRVLFPQLEASLALLRGDRAGALAALRGVLPGLEAHAMVAGVAAVRWRIGEIIGGDEGAALQAEARRWYLEQGVRDPERWARVALPVAVTCL